MAAEFTIKNADLKVNVAMNARGYIAQSGETAVGNKKFTIPNVKSTATLAEANKVWQAFLGTIAGGSFDSLSGTKSVNYNVEE